MLISNEWLSVAQITTSYEGYSDIQSILDDSVTFHNFEKSTDRIDNKDVVGQYEAYGSWSSNNYFV